MASSQTEIQENCIMSIARAVTLGRRGVFYLFLCLIFLFCFSGMEILIGREVEPNVALETIKSLENGVTALRWKGASFFGSLSDGTRYGETYFFEVLFEPSSKRHWMAVKVQKQPDTSCRVSFLSFDGKQYESLGGLVPCTEDVTLKNGGRGIINYDYGRSGEHAQFGISTGTLVTGLVSGIPGICSFMPGAQPESLSFFLAEWIKNGQLISITESEEGVWDIVSKVTIWVLPGDNNPRTRIELQYDIAKGGVITKQRVIAQRMQSGKIVDIVVKNWDIIHALNTKNQWVPKSIYQMDQSTLGYVKIDFDEFEINPPIGENSFRVAFPDGSYIDDFIAKRRYKVGDIIDEDKAIDDFIQRHGFTGDITLPKRQMALWQYILMGIGIIMILIAFYMMLLEWIAKRRQ